MEARLRHRGFPKGIHALLFNNPPIRHRAGPWELAFTTIHDRNHLVTIDFQGDEPQGILIDG